MTPQWWEDIEIGARGELGRYTFTQVEIIRFAKKYDPSKTCVGSSRCAPA